MNKVTILPLMLFFWSAHSFALPEDCKITDRIMQPNGELLASQCYQCHGYEGHSKGEIDSIAGKSASSLYGDLRDFKTNGKKDIMSLQARQYKDCELNAIAEYLSTIPAISN